MVSRTIFWTLGWTGKAERDFSAALELLAADSEKRAELSQGAIESARRYLWSEQGRRMTEVYRQLLGDGFHWSPRTSAANRAFVEVAGGRSMEVMV